MSNGQNKKLLFSRRRFAIAGIAAALAVGTAMPGYAQSIGGTAPVTAEARPNIVVFLGDDLGTRDTGPYGNDQVRTPNLDQLSRQGMTYNRAFVSSPACAPSRASLLTGLMPARHGAEPNQAAPHSWIRSLPSYLQALGYEVVAFGKVAHYRQTGRYGFDHFANDTFHDHGGIEAAVDWLEKRRDKRPLALFVGSNWPHVPWPKTTEGYEPSQMKMPFKSIDTPMTRDARARFYAAVSRMDAELGRIRAASAKTLGPETFFLFTSDHGTQWPFGKWNLYDTGIQVPLIVSWAGKVKPGTRTDAMVSWVDILPTLIDVAGGKAPADIDGKSFAPVIYGTTDVARDAIFTTHTNDGKVNVYPMRSIRTERWKYIRNLRPDWVYTTHIDQFVDRVDSGTYFPSWLASADQDARSRQIVDAYYNRPAEELYDLSADPHETRNLANDPGQKAVIKRLRAQLDAWQVQQGDTIRLNAPPHLDRTRTATE